MILLVVISCGCIFTSSENDAKSVANSESEFHSDNFSSNYTHMKVIGLISGSSWESTIEYYRLLNEGMNKRLGGLYSAKILMYSIDFQEFSQQERLGDKGNQTYLNETVIDAAKRLKNGGADFILIPDGTLNLLDDQIEEEVGIPVQDMLVVGENLKKSNITQIALIGTRSVIENEEFQDMLEYDYGKKIILPNDTEGDFMNNVIFDELCKGYLSDKSRKEFIGIINRLIDEEGAKGVLISSIEIPPWINETNIKVPVFDVGKIHTNAAIDYALNQS